MASPLKDALIALREECRRRDNVAKSAAEVHAASSKSFALFQACFKEDSESIQELMLDFNCPSPGKVIRFIYTIFDELFARTVEEEEEMVFVVKSVTLQLQRNIRPDTVKIVVPLLRHLVRFSSIPKLRTLYNYMFDIRDYYCTEFLGRGQFAEVLKGYNKQSGNPVALKKMKFLTVSKGLQSALLREASVMSKMANSSVVRLYDSFQDESLLFLVMEYSPLGDMEGYIEKKKGVFELNEISHLVRELSNGLRFLRSQSIVHRDLKPANILLFNRRHDYGGDAVGYGSSSNAGPGPDYPIRSSDLALKLTDFTMARRLDDGELAKTVCGSPLYMAPEVLNRRQYTDKADLWSVGVILYRLVFNTTPFNGMNELDLRDNLNNKPVPIPENDPRLTPILMDLLSGLLQKDPFLRIDWEEFFMHPFLRPPRLSSTFITEDSSSAATSSNIGVMTEEGDLVNLDDHTSSTSPANYRLLSISTQDAIDLQKQIREYEARLVQAQKQVQQLLGDLEQSKLRELLREQQQQQQHGQFSQDLKQPNQGSSQQLHPNQTQHGHPNHIQQGHHHNQPQNGPHSYQFGAIPNALPVAVPSSNTISFASTVPPTHPLQITTTASAASSAPTTTTLNVDPKTGIIKFTSPAEPTIPIVTGSNTSTKARISVNNPSNAANTSSLEHEVPPSSFLNTDTPASANSSPSHVIISPSSSQRLSSPHVQSLSSDITNLAISALCQKLDILGGRGTNNSIDMSSSNFSDSNMSKIEGKNEEHPRTTRIFSSPRPSSASHYYPQNSAPSSSHSASSNSSSPLNSSMINPEVVAAQSNIQLLLSQIHPDRATAIDIVQQLLAEVLVSPNDILVPQIERDTELLYRQGQSQRNLAAPSASVSAAPSSSSTASPAPSLQTSKQGATRPTSVTLSSASKPSSAKQLPSTSNASPSTSPSLKTSSPSSSSSSSLLSKPASSLSSPKQPLPSTNKGASSHQSIDSHPLQHNSAPKSTHPFGMTPEQAEAWDLERATIVAEGEQWRRLFGQLSNDYELVNAQLSEAKSMVAVLEDDLKEKEDRLANHARLEQEYTRSTIYLEDQLRGSRERVSYLEAEFQALETFRQQQKNRN